MTEFEKHDIHPDVKAMIAHYNFDQLPVEGTLYKSTYASPVILPSGVPTATAMIGMYSNNPLSVSCFHKLTSDEVWHVYAGDPFMLVLLHDDGRCEEILMGNNPLLGQHVQYTVAANTWQAGYLIDGGRYALFGCTMAPGFCGKNFIAATARELIQTYPAQQSIIEKLSVNGNETRMPAGFSNG